MQRTLEDAISDVFQNLTQTTLLDIKTQLKLDIMSARPNTLFRV